MKPNLECRVGRMMDGLLKSENEKARVVVVVEIKDATKKVSEHREFQIKKWLKGRDPKLFVSIPDTADWDADPIVKPVTPITVNLATGEIYTPTSAQDERMTPLLAYAADVALRYAFTGELPKPKNGEVNVHERQVCGYCGMKLNDPDSIRIGLGPVCEFNMTGVRRKKTTKTMKLGAAAKVGQGAFPEGF